MDIFLRTIAVIIEVLLLAAISYTVLRGVGLTAFDLGIGAKYKKAVRMALVAVVILMVVFYLAHLFTWYPAA
ncbi:MAG: hypothetical protein ABID87_03635 [Chloroflexota bacterium]